MADQPRPDTGAAEAHPLFVVAWSEWFFAWLGIAAAGGVFGFMAAAGEPDGIVLGGIIGLVAGTVIAAVVGVPITFTFAVLTWAFWLTRYAPFVAMVTGASTGAIATSATWVSVFSLDNVTSIMLAAVLGGLGGWVAMLWRRRQLAEMALESDTEDAVWQYSLRDLFWRFTVVAVLVAMWSLVIGRITGRIPN